MELARLRTEYNAAAAAAFGVGLLLLAPLAAVLVVGDGRSDAISAFLASSTTAIVAFGFYFGVCRGVARLRGRDVALSPPTLITPPGFLQDKEHSPPLHAGYEAEVDTMRRQMRGAFPAVVGLAAAFGLAPALTVVTDGTAFTSLVPTAAGLAAGQATGLALVHVLCGVWAARWEGRNDLILLRDTQKASRWLV